MQKKIRKETALGEITQKFPETVPTMLKYGLHCVGCHAAAFETLEQGAKAHGMTDQEIEKMLTEMNNSIKESNNQR